MGQLPLFNTGDEFVKQIAHLSEQGRKAEIQRNLLLKEALESKDADVIMKAQSVVQQLSANRKDSNKSYLMDPDYLQSGLGWKQKVERLSYQILRNMANVPLIKAVISTRIEQVVSFAQPQADRYAPGFRVRPKKAARGDFNEWKLTNAQEKRAEEITEFIMNCGQDTNKWHGDDFNSFLRKFLSDSLALDQATFENVFSRGQDLIEFIATDGATFRIADSYGEEHNPDFDHRQKVKGYLPAYVQLHHHRIVAEFYPWELGFCVRNPQNSVLSYGYGRSELEDLIQTVTSILNADAYNSNYFKTGSNPKGILKVSGDVNPSRINELRTEWQARMAGVENAHRMPVIEAEKLDFISTQTSNKDMEFSKFYEFLIKMVCAVYKMDPGEIGFPMNGSSDSKPLFEGNNESRIKYSRDKGLRPILGFIERVANRYWMPFIDPEWVFEFVGIDAETEAEDREADIKAVQNYAEVNEIRAKRGLKSKDGYDIILNPVIAQQKQMEAMGGGESNEAVDQMEVDEDFDVTSAFDDDNPFWKSAKEDIVKLITEE